MQKNRQLVDTIKSRLAEKSPLIQVIVGSRQVGKTTALKAALENKGIYKTADYPTPTAAELIEQWWKEAEESEAKILAIDEIQKINNWAEVIKSLWDNRKKIKLVLTGSSALLAQKSLKETLAGRFELIRAEHWNLAEANKSFNLSYEQFIEFGCYPGSINFLQDIQRWGEYIRDSIVEPALGRDLLQLYPVDSPALLRQVFSAAISLPAQIVSFQKLHHSIQEKTTVPTVQHYLNLLSQAFLITAIDKYSPAMFRVKRSSPKLIIHDNALLRAFERPINLNLDSNRLGRYIENAVGARLIEAGWDTFYWKHRNIEVDFIAIGPNNQHLALEVKLSEVDVKNLGGLREFCKQHKQFEACIISPNKTDIEGVRWIDIKNVLSISRENPSL